jgi:hypothetical protein
VISKTHSMRIIYYISNSIRDYIPLIAFNNHAAISITDGRSVGRSVGRAGGRAGGQAGRRAGGQAGRRAGGQAGRRAGRQAIKSSHSNKNNNVVNNTFN